MQMQSGILTKSMNEKNYLQNVALNCTLDERYE